jgi:AraC family transcriptional regulator, positive regulator of tynA and feaB
MQWSGRSFEGQVASFFDGVRATDRSSRPVEARVEHVDFGRGGVWRLSAGAHRLERNESLNDRTGRTFTVLLMLEGAAETWQGDRSCSVGPGQFTLVDGQQPFNVEMRSSYRKVLMHMPRQAVVTRHFGIEKRTALASDVERPGNRMFRDFLLSVSHCAEAVSFAERCTLLSASIEMLGLVEPDDKLQHRSPRIDRAIAEIELNLADPELSPEMLARRMGLSRRQADTVFERTGMSISAQIWERRLLRAASELVSPANVERRIIEVALSCGFNDPAHFSRAFRKRFGLTPSDWRSHGGQLIE